MLKKVEIKDTGNSKYLSGEIIEKDEFDNANEILKKEGKKPAIGERIIRPAHPGAVPRPPLKLEYRGQLCPMMAVIAATTSIPKESVNNLVKTTANIVFPMSKLRTNIPAHMPTVRITLVIPVMPLPCSRTSMSPKILPAINPNGTEPSRYPTTANTRKSVTNHLCL